MGVPSLVDTAIKTCEEQTFELRAIDHAQQYAASHRRKELVFQKAS